MQAELDRLGTSVASDAATERNAHRAPRATAFGRTGPRVAGIRMAGFAAAGIAAGAIVTFASLTLLPGSYETARGEQRVVTLADGSVVALNTDTRLTVEFTDEARSIVLKRGEALFQVTHDAARPFTVHAGAGYARAAGTRFNVLAQEGNVTVSVLEGRVEVTVPEAASRDLPASHAREHSALLQAGESTAYGESGRLLEPEPTRASAERIVAWREGKLRFDSWSLERAVREYNRYAEKPIRIEMPELDVVKLSGVFRIGDSAGFVAALGELVGARVVDQGDVLVLKEADQAPGLVAPGS